MLKRATFFALVAHSPPDHILTRFNIDGPLTPDKLEDWNIAVIFSHVFFGGPYFQSVGFGVSLGSFCDHFESWNPETFPGFNLSFPLSSITDNSDDALPTAEGIAATYSAEKALFAYLCSRVLKAASDKFSRPGGARRPPVDFMSWNWQLCSQNAQFQLSDSKMNPDTYIIA